MTDNIKSVPLTAKGMDGNKIKITTESSKLTTSAGNVTQPVYFEDGVPKATTHTLGKSVPSDAVFTDTTYSVMSGATSTTAGKSGLVPAPSAGDNTKVLHGDGTWKEAEGFDSYWKPGEAISVGDIRYIPGRENSGYILECVQAGTTGSSAPEVSEEDVEASAPTGGSSSGGSGGITALDIYPVGSLYWSKKSTNPGTLFGGTWTQIRDKFILAAGGTYTVGSTGGASTVTLTANQMPSHTHTGTADSVNGHTHSVSTTFRYGADPSTGNTTAAWDIGDRSNSTVSSVTSGSAGAHSHNVTINSTGGNAAHDNMPPYVVYYCWERTA